MSACLMHVCVCLTTVQLWICGQSHTLQSINSMVYFDNMALPDEETDSSAGVTWSWQWAAITSLAGQALEWSSSGQFCCYQGLKCHLLRMCCRCSHEFCYRCGGPWKGKCTQGCEVWDEDMLLAEEDRARQENAAVRCSTCVLAIANVQPKRVGCSDLTTAACCAGHQLLRFRCLQICLSVIGCTRPSCAATGMLMESAHTMTAAALHTGGMICAEAPTSSRMTF